MRGKYDSIPALQGLIYLILILGLANHNDKPSQRSQWLFFIPIASICIYMIFFCASSDPVVDLFTASPIVAIFFNSVDYILLRKYQHELRPLGQKPLSKLPLKDRLWWAAGLTINPRGIGWTHEPTQYLPPRPSSTSRKFILSQLMWMGFYILLFDIINLFMRKNPCFATGGPSFTAFGWLWRSTVWLLVPSIYSTLSLLSTASSIVAVSIGISEPRDWPRLYGSPLDAYTVRNCWGRVWHQMLRKVVTAHGDFITKKLGLRKGTFRTCLKLFIAFFVSGLIHESGDYVLDHKWTGYSLKFFLLQAAAIICEDIIIKLAIRAGFSSKPNPFVKFIGFLWVFAWFTYSLPLMDISIHAGTMDNVNYSLVLRLWQGHWTPIR